MKKNIASVHLVLRVSIFAWTLIINLWTTMVLTDYARTRELLTLFISQKCVCLFWAGTFLYFRMTWISFYLLNMLCRSTCVWLTLPLTWPKLSPSTKGHLGRLLLTCLRRSFTRQTRRWPTCLVPREQQHHCLDRHVQKCCVDALENHKRPAHNLTPNLSMISAGWGQPTPFQSLVSR